MAVRVLELAYQQVDVAQPQLVAGMQHYRLAGAQRLAADGRAVGRAEILDLQRLAGEAEAGMAARHGGVRHDEVALIGGAADHHALRADYQLLEVDLEGVLVAGRVGALEAQRDLRDHLRRRTDGDSSLGRPHMKDLDGAAHILELVLAAVDEGVFDAQLDEIAHGARHGDAAGFGQRLDAGGEIDAVAEDVLVLLVDDDFAQVDT